MTVHRHAYDGLQEEYSLAAGVVCPPEEDKAQQQFAEESDINTIVRRFGLTGTLPQTVRVPKYGDFTVVTDYKTAMDAVREADSNFMELPAPLRAEFDNDPQKLLEFMGDAKNRDKAIELGLLPKPVQSAAAKEEGAT